MTQLHECEYCGAKNETDLCSKCKADFDESIRWFLEEYARECKAARTTTRQ